MKLFSFKTFALAFVVIAGSANATISETIQQYATSAKNTVNAADAKLFGSLKQKIAAKFADADVTEVTDIGSFNRGFFPFNTFDRYISQNKFAHAAFVVAIAAIPIVAYKAYKHFTKPAVEAENVEANEANTEVVA